MLTKRQIIQAFQAGRTTHTLDGRDLNRLVEFFTPAEAVEMGLTVVEGADWKAKEWTNEAVLVELKGDLEFAFQKALNKRGISASLMVEVVKMWMWVLEDPLEHESDRLYAQYGLPFLKAVAVKYELPNPIGNDAGTEFKYSSDGDL
jgi:hypothetical protein